MAQSIAIEETALWQRYKTRGDLDAREQLILQHLDLVKYIAGRMAVRVPASVSEDDLLGWGILGLLDAIEKFDVEQNIKFATYAAFRVRGAIIDEIRSLDWAPRTLRLRARQVDTAAGRLRGELGREPTTDEIARQLNMKPKDVEEVLANVRNVATVSLNEMYTDENGEAVYAAAFIADGEAGTPLDDAMRQESIDLLAEAISRLPETQQQVLHLYYYEELTLKEIGAVIEVSESRICQIHKEATKRLRAMMAEP